MSSANKYKKNKKAKNKISIIQNVASLTNNNDAISQRCKFNFHYFSYQEGVSQKFDEWNHNELVKLLEKLKVYSEQSLEKWSNTPAGQTKSFNTLVVYDNFPNLTDFIEPSHFPKEAKWARFRLESKVRLIGFVIPLEYTANATSLTGIAFDSNTFYVVYLDKNHLFWKMEEN